MSGAHRNAETEMSPPRPFRIQVPDEVLEGIRAKVAAYPWHEMPDDGGWDYGTNLDYMKELCAFWLQDCFDWRAQEERLNRFSRISRRRWVASTSTTSTRRAVVPRRSP